MSGPGQIWIGIEFEFAPALPKPELSMRLRDSWAYTVMEIPTLFARIVPSEQWVSEPSLEYTPLRSPGELEERVNQTLRIDASNQDVSAARHARQNSIGLSDSLARDRSEARPYEVSVDILLPSSPSSVSSVEEFAIVLSINHTLADLHTGLEIIKTVRRAFEMGYGTPPTGGNEVARLAPSPR